MKNLLRATLVLGGLVSASGCFSFWGDTNSSRFALTWAISTEASQESDCGTADADTIVVTTTVAGKERKTVLFDCHDMGGATDGLPVGPYTVETGLGMATARDIE
jgi:hypothetical protein